MSEKPKKMTRRDFLHTLFLGTSSLAASQLTGNRRPNALAKILQKTDKIGRGRRPWWIKELEQPTTNIRWEQLQRFDARSTVSGGGFIKYVGSEEVLRLGKIRDQLQRQNILDNKPGYSLKDQALQNAQSSLLYPRLFLGPEKNKTPEELSVPPWEGSPKEATSMLRAAMRHLGASTVGVVELNENTRKLIYSHDPDGKQLVYENIEQAYETEDKRVIPYKAKWVIVFTVQMSLETMKHAPNVLAHQTATLSYNRGSYVQIATQNFLRGLGYQCLGESSLNALGIAPAFAVLAGLGEMSRLNRLITPEYGPMVRVFKLITDLPLVPDKPIDAGIMGFCKSCKKCAEACPPAALSFADEPSWETEGGWNNPGHQAYFENSIRCLTYWREKTTTGCGICFAVCPFAKDDKVWLHDWVRSTVATLPLFNKYLRNLDDAFSYGAMKDPLEWWELDLPEYGINTERSADQ